MCDCYGVRFLGIVLLSVGTVAACGCDQLAGTARSDRREVPSSNSQPSNPPTVAGEQPEPGDPSAAAEVSTPTDEQELATQLKMQAAVARAWRKMVDAERGDPERVAIIRLLDIEKLDVGPTLRQRVGTLASEFPRLRNSLHIEPSRAAVILAPAKEPRQLAQRLGVGRVIAFDDRWRIVDVVADPSLFPKNDSGKATDPTHPEYFRVNYQRLRGGAERAVAAQRLAEADADRCRDFQLRDQIAEQFRKLVAAEDPVIGREVALTGIVNWEGQSAVPFLIDLLKQSVSEASHPYHEKYFLIIHALGEVGDARAAEPLVELLQSSPEAGKDIPYRSDLAAALIAIGETAEPAVLAAAPNPHPQVSLTAIEVLGEIGTSKSLDVLRRAARIGSPEIRAAAVKATSAIKERLRERAAS